jgi:hypothetical protein
VVSTEKSGNRPVGLKSDTVAKKKRKVNLASFYKMQAVIIVSLAVLSCGLFFGFISLDKYVKRAVPVAQRTGVLELVGPPWWLNDALKEKIYTAATANGENLKLDEDAAESVRLNLQKAGGWLDDVRVQTTSQTIRIRAKWRRPLAIINTAKRAVYVDADSFVIDYVEVPGLPIIKIEGAKESADLLQAGKICRADDIAAAVAVLERLDKRDSLEQPGRGLLGQIARIDVSNFDGRKSEKNPHIVLYATDDTAIIWGAEVGKWYRHLEVTDEQKIARLYSYFCEKGTLLGGAKTINLRDPKENVPLPIDKYIASEK